MCWKLKNKEINKIKKTGKICKIKLNIFVLIIRELVHISVNF